MRVLRALLLPLLPLTALAASKSSNDKFADFHAKSLSSTPLKLDSASFGKLTGSPRNYSAAVLLTALDARFGCELCQKFQPEWTLLAKSWTNGDKSGQSRMLFGTLDFADGREIFQAMGLQTAPVLVLYHPSVGPGAKADNQPSRYDFSSGASSAESTHAWIARQLPEDVPRPRVQRPFNWFKTIVGTITVLGLFTFATVAYPYVSFILNNRNLWAAVCIFAILLFTSGHMFNQIRKVPYVVGDGKGGISYFAGGFQSQYGLESQLVAVIYGILAFATISLALTVPRMVSSQSQQVAVFVWSAVMLFTYSFLISTFKIKNGGYPLWIPPF